MAGAGILMSPTPAGADSAWSVTASQNPGASQDNQFQGVSCTSSTFCVGVGNTDTSTVIETFDGTSWTVSSSVSAPDGGSEPVLLSVSCVTTTFCVAVGDYTTSGGVNQNLIYMWNGTSWMDTSVNTYSDERLTAVSCTSSSFCVTLGNYIASGSVDQVYTETFDGTSWTEMDGANTSNSVDNFISGVSCTSSNFCVAVGYTIDGSSFQTIAETFDGTSWTLDATLNPEGSPALLGISCTSSSFCIAVGYNATSESTDSLAETFDGTSWTLSPSVNDASTDTQLQSVSCTSSSFCMAVGYDANYLTVAETFDGTSWTLDSPQNPGAEGGTNELLGVSCASSSLCLAVGWFVTDVGPDWQTLAEAWTPSSALPMLTITASSTSMSYGSTPPTITAGYSGFVNGDTASSLTTQPTCSTDATSISPVLDSYTSSCTGAVDSNYQINYVEGSVAVTPAPTSFMITVNGSSSATITSGSPATLAETGLPTGATGTVTFTSGETVLCTITLPATGCQTPMSLATGNYQNFTGFFADTDGNYSGSTSTNTVSLTVNPASGPPVLTITASSTSMTYGSTPPTITANYSGFVNGDTASSLTTQPTCSTTASSTSPVSGSYTSSCTGAVDSNYQIDYVEGSVAVTPAPTSFTITVNGSSSATIASGSPATFAETGLPTRATGAVTFTSGATTLCVVLLPTPSCATSTSLAVGSYPTIAATFADLNGHYRGSTSMNTVSLTVNPFPSPITEYVTNCRDSGPGSLRDAVTNATPGDAIRFRLPRSKGSCHVITLKSGVITIATDLNIDGPGANTLAVSGDNISTVFLVSPFVTANISGLTIEDGSATAGAGIYNSGGGGGGIYNYFGTLTLTDTTVSHNIAGGGGGGLYNYFGGGIYNFGGTLTLNDSTVSDNTAAYGGGIYNEGPLTLNDSTVSGDSADEGGGIYNEDTLNVTNSTISGNACNTSNGVTGAYGGGIYNEDTLNVTNSTISGNTCNNSNGVTDAYGGGIYNGGTLSLTDSNLSENSTSLGYGGGIYNDATLNLTDSTLSDNSATLGYVNGPAGGGIYNGGTLKLTGSTLSDNTAGVSPGILADVSGGGIANLATATVTDSTLSDNTAVYGGGIDNGGTLKLTRSTLSDNTAGDPGYGFVGKGGGIYNHGGSSVLVATIVAGSGTGFDCAGTSSPPVADGGYNLDDDGSCGFSTANNSLSDTSADLASSTPRANGGPTKTIALKPGSKAFDHVTSASDCTGTDQRGVPWPTPCDIGAIQAGDIDSTTVTLSSSTVHVGAPVTATARVNPSDGGGTVLILITLGGTAVGNCGLEALKSKEATCEFRPSTAGRYTFTAIYSGDATYGDSQGSTSGDVIPPRKHLL
jgi:hypothetical protein